MERLDQKIIHSSAELNNSDMTIRQKKMNAKELGLDRFPFLIKISEQFPQAQIYVVGGAVRDFLLGRASKDLDFVVRGVPAEELEEFLEGMGRINLVGRNFGVFKFVPSGGDDHNPIDIALPRTEHALGTGGYHDFEVQSDPELPIEDDLSRRDFTVNAIALDITRANQLRIVDPFSGLKDLKDRVLRAVGKPDDRFKEDYSRMLRAIRFACQIGFKIEDQTWQAIVNNISHLNDIRSSVELVVGGASAENEVKEERVVPYEVAAKEFLKSLISDPICAMDLSDAAGVFRELIPELLTMKNCPQPENFHSEGDVWVHTRLALEKLKSPEFVQQFPDQNISIGLILAVLFHDIGKPSTLTTPDKHGSDRIRFNEHDITGAKMAKSIFNRLRLSSPEGLGVDIDKVAWLIQHHMILVHGNIDEMREGTIEKYFFNSDYPSEDLLKLSWLDIAATVPPDGHPNFTQFNQMLARIERLKSLSETKKSLPPALLDGKEIMQLFSLKPGRRIGELKDALREEQLSGRVINREAAVDFLRRYLA